MTSLLQSFGNDWTRGGEEEAQIFQTKVGGGGY